MVWDSGPPPGVAACPLAHYSVTWIRGEDSAGVKSLLRMELSNAEVRA